MESFLIVVFRDLGIFIGLYFAIDRYRHPERYRLGRSRKSEPIPIEHHESADHPPLNSLMFGHFDQDCYAIGEGTEEIQPIEASDADRGKRTPYDLDAEKRIVKLLRVDREGSSLRAVYEQVLVCGALEMEWTEPRTVQYPDWQCAPLGMYRWHAESGEKSVVCRAPLSNLRLANVVFAEQPELLRAVSVIGPFNTIDMIHEDDDFLFPKETILDVLSLFASRAIAVSRIELIQADYCDQWPMGEIVARMSFSSPYSEGSEGWLEFVSQRRSEAEKFIGDHPAGDEQFYRIDGVSKDCGVFGNTANF